MSSDNLVFDLVIDVRRYDLALYEIVIAAKWSMDDDRLHPRGTDAGKPVEAVSTRRVYIAQLPGLLVAVVDGELGDLVGDAVCATAGSASSVLNPIAAK